MAQLPPDGDYLIQQDSGVVTVFQRHTETVVAQFDPGDPQSFGPALQEIWTADELQPETKCFAAFWSGYFYAHQAAQL